MRYELGTQASIMIKAPATEVRKAITSPDFIKRWFFGVDTETDWVEGSPIVHRGEYEGRPYVDKGTILKVEPGRLLVNSHWSDLSGPPDRPENYQELSWALPERDGTTLLTVTEHNLPSEEAKATSEQGWRAALAGLQDLFQDRPGRSA